MQIIDSHVHYWEPSSPERPWDPKGFNHGPPYSVEQILAAVTPAGVTKIVQVTPTIMGYDNTYALEAAEKYPDRVAGVFALFDPFVSNMAERLATLRRHSKFWGIRLPFVAPPLSTSLQDRTLDPFLTKAGELRIPVSIHPFSKLLASTAQRHPQTRIILDHVGLRSRDQDPFAPWPEVLALASVPNVWIKVSCFPEVAREPYPFPMMQRRFKEVVDTFGPDRLIWGSNFPPSAKACSYQESVDFALKSSDFLADKDRAKIFGETLLNVVHGQH